MIIMKLIINYYYSYCCCYNKIVADEYISAMPVDIMKRFIPKAW